MYGVGIGAGDEVVGPTMTYWASLLPCMTLNAVPIFADVDPTTLCIDPNDIRHRITDDTKAIVAVHQYGHPCDMDAIVEIANEHDLEVIEDVSHAHGGRFEGEKVGTIGDVGAMSLMSLKPLPCGEGGALVTDDREVYERALAFGHYRRHDEIESSDLAPYTGIPHGGQKHRMHQVSAAMGRVQLAEYPDRMQEIQRAMNYFWDLLADEPEIQPHRPDRNTSTMGGWYEPKGLYATDEVPGVSVDRFAEAVVAEGSICSPGVDDLLHEHRLFDGRDIYGHGEPTRQAFARRPIIEDTGSYPTADGIHDRTFDVPWFKQYRPDTIEKHAMAYTKVLENIESLT
jgi:dTDP-4-amino-4,6-dideoxygalactose transaminase